MPGRATIVTKAGRIALRVTATDVDLWSAWDELRRLSSLPHVATVGERHGFRVEDITELVAYVGLAGEMQRWLERRLPAECTLDVRPSDARGGVTLDARFARRGDIGTSQRSHYQRGADGRVRVEACELHPVEHCNLRCAYCCNLSPYVPPRFHSTQSVVHVAREMARFMVADVFKITGGEPLLHPDITAMLHGVRGTGIAPVVRLFSNGLLLHSMPDAFWAALDQLTLSHYASAPLPAGVLAEITAKAKAFDVVLNIKPVQTFSRIVSTTRNSEPARLAQIYRSCWLRHRCLMVRDGVFYMCTRAAYADVFRARFLGDDASPEGERDGIRVGGEDFSDRLLAYLNRTQPLDMCAYCLGAEGPSLPHRQLTPADVRAHHLWGKEAPEG